MIEFLVKHYSDDIIVSINQQEFMTVKRKYNFWGKLTSKFYKDDKLILETTYDIAFFRKYLSIEIQNLPDVLALQKLKGNYLLNYGNISLRVKRKYFKNPLYELYEDGVMVGEVKGKVNGVLEHPTKYTVSFYKVNEANLYLLLLFLMGLDSRTVS